MLYSNIYNKIHTILDIDDATDFCILRGHPGFVQIPNWTVIAHCYVSSSTTCSGFVGLMSPISCIHRRILNASERPPNAPARPGTPPERSRTPMACPGPANAPGNACARLPHASERPFGHRSLGKECRSRERNLVYCIQLTYV